VGEICCEIWNQEWETEKVVGGCWGCMLQLSRDISLNSGTKRRHKGAPPLVGESELKHESELKPYRIGYDRDLIL
jgi:hypothetical protein